VRSRQIDVQSLPPQFGCVLIPFEDYVNTVLKRNQ
jgi:hypothetical protein